MEVIYIHENDSISRDEILGGFPFVILTRACFNRRFITRSLLAKYESVSKLYN